MKPFFFISLLILGGCQTRLHNASLERAPDAASAPVWEELVTSDPGTFLETRSTQSRIQKQRNQFQVLQSCAGQSAGAASILDMDLLFIRLENWPTERLEKEYLSQMSVQTLRCLQDNTSYLGS